MAKPPRRPPSTMRPTPPLQPPGAARRRAPKRGRAPAAGAAIAAVALVVLLLPGALGARLYSSGPPFSAASYASFNATRSSGCSFAGPIGVNGTPSTGTLRAAVLVELTPWNASYCDGYARAQSFSNWSGPTFTSPASGVYHVRVVWKVAWWAAVRCGANAYGTLDNASAKVQLGVTLVDLTTGASGGPSGHRVLLDRSGCGPYSTWSASGVGHNLTTGTNATLTSGDTYRFDLSLEVEAFLSGAATLGSCPPSLCPPVYPHVQVDIGSGTNGATPTLLRVR